MDKTRYNMGLTDNFIKIPIEKLVCADWNYKTEDAALTEKLTNNIKRNGQLENIVVRELDTGFYEVVNGNHRIPAFKTLEFEMVMCYNLGVVSQNQAMRIAIELNETRFDTDQTELARIIKDLAVDFDLSDLETTMPYSLEELGNFEKLLDFDWGTFEDTGDGITDDPKPKNKCPECGHEW